MIPLMSSGLRRIPMKKPYIICRMMTSVDGRIDCAMTEHLPGVQEYYDTLDSLNAPTRVSGRVAAELEMAKPGVFHGESVTPLGRDPAQNGGPCPHGERRRRGLLLSQMRIWRCSSTWSASWITASSACSRCSAVSRWHKNGMKRGRSVPDLSGALLVCMGKGGFSCAPSGR